MVIAAKILDPALSCDDSAPNSGNFGSSLPFGSQMPFFSSDEVLNGSAPVILAKVGADLHLGIFPEVLTDGVVVPSGATSSYPLGKRNSYERSQTAPRKSSTWRQEAATTAGTASSPTSIKRADLQATHEAQLDELVLAYPRTKVEFQDGGMWLLTESSVVEGLGKAAAFLTAVSFTRPFVRSWGFWRQHSIGVSWIGPRHTNFPDGSICAFAPEDSTWVVGDSLATLLDLYTVWAFRHLHLEEIGFWPGQQVIGEPFERTNEVQEVECCGCGSTILYKNCCMQRDRARNILRDAVHFMLAPATREPRLPPRNIVQAMLGLYAIPPIADIQVF